MSNNTKEYWITNISKIILSLDDLDVSLRPMQSYNLLHKSYQLTLEQIKESEKNGSIAKKIKFLVIGNQPYKMEQPQIKLALGSPSTVQIAYEEIQKRSLIDLEQENLTDEKFVDDMLNAEEDEKNNRSKKKK